MSLTIQTFAAGPIETNAYLVIDDATSKALIVDAPWEVTDTILTAASEAEAEITTIYITHSHWDHIGDAAALQERLGVPVLSHKLSEPGVSAPNTAGAGLPFTIPAARVDKLVEDGDTVELGETSFTVMHLPGHEPGHTALYSEKDNVFLGGDVLFPGGYGRIDIPGASEEAMAASMKRLAVLPGEVKVYPGHGLPTTIGAETWLQSYR